VTRDRETGPSGTSRAHPHPVLPGERILALDLFRGFAMFGVLIAYVAWSLGTRPEETWSPLDQSLGEAIGFAIDGKFYTILAILFGLGFHLQTRAAKSARDEAVELYVRRLMVLAGIGLAHGMLLRDGDILLPYALTGLFLVPFHRASDRAVLAGALLALLVPAAMHWLFQASGWAVAERPGEVEGYFAKNAAWLQYWYATAPFNWPQNLTLFLFGLYAGRRNIVARLSARPGAAAVVLVAGLAASVLFYAVRARIVAGAPDHPSILQSSAYRLLFDLHAWGLAASYLAGLLLLLRAWPGSRALHALGAVGRMALTNYLMQAALIVPLCLAFGLFDIWTPSRALLFAVALFVLVQVPFSLAWLRHFDFGPAEWAWRALTYGGALPIRRQAASSL
jgi:uncharacterized protein